MEMVPTNISGSIGDPISAVVLWLLGVCGGGGGWLEGEEKRIAKGRAAHRRMENRLRARERSDEKETLDRPIALIGVWLLCCAYV
jgi:hypothetical protein